MSDDHKRPQVILMGQEDKEIGASMDSLGNNVRHAGTSNGN